MWGILPGEPTCFHHSLGALGGNHSGLKGWGASWRPSPGRYSPPHHLSPSPSPCHWQVLFQLTPPHTARTPSHSHLPHKKGTPSGRGHLTPSLAPSGKHAACWASTPRPQDRRPPLAPHAPSPGRWRLLLRRGPTSAPPPPPRSPEKGGKNGREGAGGRGAATAAEAALKEVGGGPAPAAFSLVRNGFQLPLGQQNAR